MTDEREFEDLAQEIRATREEPRADFARELDRRAADWLRERPRRRLPSMRVAIPALGAAAAAAVVIALAVSGGEDGGEAEPLDVAVRPEGPLPGAAPGTGAPPGTRGTPPAAAVPEVLETPLQSDSTADGGGSSTGPGGGAFLLLTQEGDTVSVRYLFSTPAEAEVELAGHEAEVEIGQGAGSLEISTAGLPPGTHDLTISAPPTPTYRERVEIAD